jgi:bifunctional DNA-binding transcriptional regulator/antitoxin component of YhaV-PrlF toxin-antitoxin module
MLITIEEGGIITFPKELVDKLGWVEGDTIIWKPIDEQSYSLELEAREQEYDDTERKKFPESTSIFRISPIEK